MKGDSRFTVGVVLVLLAFIAPVVTPFAIIFSLPVFLIGALMIAFSDQGRIKKLVAIIAPLALVLPAAHLFMQLRIYLGPDPVPETFLIPSGVTGHILIIRNETCGVAPRFENGRFAYDVPRNRVLIVRSGEPEGLIDEEYIVVDSNGQRTFIGNTHGRVDSSHGVIVEGSGNGSYSRSDGCSFTYMKLVVHRIGEPRPDYDDGLRVVACSLVAACRSRLPVIRL